MTSIAATYAAIGLSPSIAQLTFAKSICGEPLSLDEREIYRLCTGRDDYEPVQFQEATGICGRKSGKTEYIAAPVIVHRACTDLDEPGTYLIVAPSRMDQARIAWQAVIHQLECGFPNLIAEVRESEGWVLLHNGNVIKIASGNFRNLRGPKYKVVSIAEACFFNSNSPDEGGANPLEFILDSVAGGMVATAHPLLLLDSTPWIMEGIVWAHYRDRAANPDRLVWRAPTLLMNPTANQALMERHRKDRGESFFRREYLAEFSEDSFAFIEAADIEAAISDVPFFPPKSGVRYFLGLDPGRRRDHFGAATAHREADVIFVDWSAEWKPGLFGLKYRDVLPEVFQKAREYSIKKIASDQIDFGGIEASIPLVNGVPEFTMERVMTGGQSGAELADVTRALFAQRKIVLPNQRGLADEFKRLADYLTQGGARDIRSKRGHDDRSRAVMLAVHQAFSQPVARKLFRPEMLDLRRPGSGRLDPSDRWFHEV